MTTEIEEMILAREMRLLGEEAVNNHLRADQGNNASRQRMFQAQVALVHQMYLYLDDEEENWEWSNFRNKLNEVIDLQYSLYREARTKQDRDTSLITLGRIRALITLSRRLDNPQRQREAAFQLELSRFAPQDAPVNEPPQ